MAWIYLNASVLGKQYTVVFCKWRDDDTLFNIFHALNAEADYENLSIDSTSVKAHRHSAGAKKGL